MKPRIVSFRQKIKTVKNVIFGTDISEEHKYDNRNSLLLFYIVCIFSTAVSTAALMQSVTCKPYIFTNLRLSGNVPLPTKAETSGGRWHDGTTTDGK